MNSVLERVEKYLYIGTMSTKKQLKINQLLSTHPQGTVLTSMWLGQQGYSLDLQKRYKRSHWFESIGSGALIRTGDQVDYLGGIYALQAQLGSSLHPGGKTALQLQGKSHYLELSSKHVILFAGEEESPPTWFAKWDWGIKLEVHKSAFLPQQLGLVDLDCKTFAVKVSHPIRAIMECLYLAPQKQPLMEMYELLEGLNNVRPTLVQSLLEQCRSIKVKRLFLYLAEKTGHEWFDYLTLSNIDLGKGKRSFAKDGSYNRKYQITVPKELA